MNSVSNRQANIALFATNKGFGFEYEHQLFELDSMDKVHAFFQEKGLDTIKLTKNGKSEYPHFIDDEIKVFEFKQDLRKTLRQENGGAWVEEMNGKKRFFVDNSGLFQTSFKQVCEEEYLQRLESPSTVQKILEIGIMALGLLPSFANITFDFLQHKTSPLGVLGLSFLPSTIDAQAIDTEFQINTYTTSNQQNPNAALLKDGGFVAIWESNGQDGSGYGVFGQRYNSSSVPVGSEFQINTYSMGEQRFPVLASLSNGGFVAAWQSEFQDGSGYGIYGKWYDNNGAVIGGEFLVNTYTINDQCFPAIASLKDGGIIISWDSNGQDGGNFDVYGKRYDSNGMPNGAEFQINTYTVNQQQFSSIAALIDGGFIITWQSYGQDGNKFGIYAQRYNSSGTPSGSETQINSYTLNDQLNSSVAPLYDGGYVVTWTSDGQDGNDCGIYGRHFTSDGLPTRSEFQANTYVTNNQSNSSIAPLNNGGFIVTWQSYGQDGNGFGIFAQRFGSDGIKNTSEFQVNSYTSNNQTYPFAMPLIDDGFLFIWQSFGQDGSGFGIYGQRYDANGLAVGPETIEGSSLKSTQKSALSSLLITENSSSFIPTSLNSNSEIIRYTISANNVTLSQKESASIPTTTVSVPFESSSFSSSSTQSRSVSRVSTIGTPSFIRVVYGEPYPVTLNGETIGSYTFSGGSGQLSGINSNILTLEFNSGHEPVEGQTISLFTIPEEEIESFENTVVVSENLECLDANGEIIESSEGVFEYQIIFEKADSCVTTAPKAIASLYSIFIN